LKVTGPRDPSTSRESPRSASLQRVELIRLIRLPRANRINKAVKLTRKARCSNRTGTRPGTPRPIQSTRQHSRRLNPRDGLDIRVPKAVSERVDRLLARANTLRVVVTREQPRNGGLRDTETIRDRLLRPTRLREFTSLVSRLHIRPSASGRGIA